MTARLKAPWGQPVKLQLSDKDNFTSHLPAPAEFDSTLEQKFAENFGESRAGWQLIREGEILHEHQTAFVPDFVFRHEDGTEVLFEIVGFWTPEYLDHRRKTLARFREQQIMIALPKASLKEGVTPSENVILYKTTIKVATVVEALEKIRNPKSTK